MSITYSECVFVTLGIQYARSMRHIVIRGLSGSAMFVHIMSQMARFSVRGGGVTEHKMCVVICSTNIFWIISGSKKKWAKYDQKCVMVFMKIASYSWKITKL